MARLGYLSIVGAAVLWAVGGTTAAYVTARGASVVELAEARAWVSIVGVGAILLLRRRRLTPPRRNPRTMVGTLIVFGMSIAVANFSYYLSVSLIPVAVSIVVQYTAPALVVGWTAFVQRRRPGGVVVAALFMVMVGVAALAEVQKVLTGQATDLNPAGVIMALVAAVAFAIYVVVGEKVSRDLGAERSVFYGFLVAGTFWLVVQIARGRPDTLLDSRFIGWALFLGVVSTIAPFLLFVWGLQHVDASRAGIVSTFEPLAAAILAFFWLGQTLTISQIIGGLVVLAGIIAVQGQASPEPRPDWAAVE